jgi:RNA polymerase sigma-70 factor (ECF subfamily)
MIDYNELPDEEVVKLIRLSNQELYFILVKRYQDKLLRYVTNIVLDEYKAVDVVQETFIKSFVNLNGFDLNKKFSSWIYRIAHNESINLLKKNRRETFLPEDLDFSSEENLVEDLEQKELVQNIGKCLGSLPLMYSEPLVLHFT